MRFLRHAVIWGCFFCQLGVFVVTWSLMEDPLAELKRANVAGKVTNSDQRQAVSHEYSTLVREAYEAHYDRWRVMAALLGGSTFVSLGVAIWLSNTRWAKGQSP